MIKKINKSYIIIILISTILAISLYCLDQYITIKLRSQLMISLNDISNQNVKLINSEIDSKLNLLTNLAKNFSGYKEEDLKNSVDEIDKITKNFNFKETGIATKDGIAYINSGNVFDVSKRDYFIKSINGEKYVSSRIIDMEYNEAVNVYSVPIYGEDESKIIGVFFVSYDNEEFVKLLQVTSFEGSGYSYIIDSKGDIITDSEKLNNFQDEENLFDILINNGLNSSDKRLNNKAINEFKEGISNNKSINTEYIYKQYKYAVSEKLDVNDWWLITVVPKSILSDRIMPIINGVHLITISVILITIVVFIYIINKDRKSGEKLKEVAYKDSFTGLYNKNYLKEKVNCKYLNRKDLKSAIVIYNVRNFKSINELYGMDSGDYIIKQIASLLKDTKENSEEIVARNSADEFIALYFYEDKYKLERRLKKIQEKVKIISYNDNKLFLELYVGVCEVLNPENDFEKLYNYANIAKNESKKSVDEFYKYFNKELAESDIHEKKLENEINEGILNKEFKAWFQPKYDCKTKKIVGCEALARWYKKDGKVYFPNEFIDLSEKNGLIKDIDKLIFEDVCINIREWKRKGINIVPVSLNISRAYLNNIDIVYELREMVNKYGISPKYIQLEITESSLVSNEKMLHRIIEEMHRCGFKVLLDDFGVGYSSLNAINNLKFDTLKIDKSFVDAIDSSSGKYILKYTINLGRSLGMEVVVEGVESKEQYDFLKENDCNTIQGYYFSKPLNKDDFEEILEI